jgi:hypothetical protein
MRADHPVRVPVRRPACHTGRRLACGVKPGRGNEAADPALALHRMGAGAPVARVGGWAICCCCRTPPPRAWRFWSTLFQLSGLCCVTAAACCSCRLPAATQTPTPLSCAGRWPRRASRSPASTGPVTQPRQWRTRRRCSAAAATRSGCVTGLNLIPLLLVSANVLVPIREVRGVELRPASGSGPATQTLTTPSCGRMAWMSVTGSAGRALRGCSSSMIKMATG